jgi:hypothetical protein
LDILSSILYIALKVKNNETEAGLLRLCCFTLQVLSSERKFSVSLNSPFNQTLPSGLDIPLFSGTYADLLTLTVYSLISSVKSRLANFLIKGIKDC